MTNKLDINDWIVIIISVGVLNLIWSFVKYWYIQIPLFVLVIYCIVKIVGRERTQEVV